MVRKARAVVPANDGISPPRPEKQGRRGRSPVDGASARLDGAQPDRLASDHTNHRAGGIWPVCGRARHLPVRTKPRPGRHRRLSRPSPGRSDETNLRRRDNITVDYGHHADCDPGSQSRPHREMDSDAGAASFVGGVAGIGRLPDHRRWCQRAAGACARFPSRGDDRGGGSVALLRLRLAVGVYRLRRLVASTARRKWRLRFRVALGGESGLQQSGDNRTA
jgi:hypothetical protein